MKGKKGPPLRRRYTSGSSPVDRQIERWLSFVEDPLDKRLAAEVMTSGYRLAQDHSSTLDLKVINSAVKELRYAFKVFSPYRAVRKVAVFGSARLLSRHPAYGMAKEFGRKMVQAGWMVITGAASGIMKAGHEGAGRRASFGLNIRLPFEQEANPVIAKDEKLINFKYFFTRKLLFIKESHATVLFAGGFGTLDEGFESLTLMQTGKSDLRPIVFVDTPRGRFWKPLIEFFEKRMVGEGVISPSDRSLYRVVHSAEEAKERILRFYSVYHSMRMVGKNLVLRLRRPLSEDQLKNLTRRFKDLLLWGGITQGSALPEEADEPELDDLTRLVLQFNRKDYGRLMELVDAVNDA
ncbi:MAG: LOG family protein [Candidatus Omnitrophica bacterium]|nr:LOG family protein [Candidatus Omnitrophota bacterium]